MYRQLQIKISFPHARSWASFPTIPRCGSRLIARNVCLALRTWGRSTDLVTNLLSRTKILLCPDIQDFWDSRSPDSAEGPPINQLSETALRTCLTRRPAADHRHSLVRQRPVLPSARSSERLSYPCTSIPAPVIQCDAKSQGVFCKYRGVPPMELFFSSPFHLQFTFVTEDCHE